MIAVCVAILVFSFATKAQRHKAFLTPLSTLVFRHSSRKPGKPGGKLFPGRDGFAARKDK